VVAGNFASRKTLIATTGPSREAPGLELRNSSAVSKSIVRVCTVPSALGKVLASILNVLTDKHKSVDVPRGYVRDADAFRGHAGAGLLEERRGGVRLRGQSCRHRHGVVSPILTLVV
jgi:hypothetical protein